MARIAFMYTIFDSDNKVMHTFVSDTAMDKLSIAVEFAINCDYLFVWTNNSCVFVAQTIAGELNLFHFEVEKVRFIY